MNVKLIQNEGTNLALVTREAAKHLELIPDILNHFSSKIRFLWQVAVLIAP